MADFVKAVDFGTALEVSVDGVVRVVRVSQNKVRISYFAQHVGADGATENRVILHTDWDIEIWAKCQQLYATACREILGESAPADAGAIIALLQ